MARATVRQISFADVELMRQGVRLEPLLEAISKFLDSQHEMIERVRRDLVRGLSDAERERIDSNTLIYETHPHNGIPHFHSLTRLVVRKTR